MEQKMKIGNFSVDCFIIYVVKMIRLVELPDVKSGNFSVDCLTIYVVLFLGFTKILFKIIVQTKEEWILSKNTRIISQVYTEN